MEDKYLNKTLTGFYVGAFNHIKECTDASWKLNTELLPHLELINQNPYIKTLFSKGFEQHNTKLSFLEFAYFKSVEDKLECTVFPKLREEFECISITKKAPIEHKFKVKDEHLKYIFSKDYLNLWHYHIELDSDNKAEHNRFWSVVSELLS